MDARVVRLYFACVGNSARSQMAEAICRQLGGERVVCASGGSDPYGKVLPHALTVLEEIGAPTDGLESTPLDEGFVATCDLVITMGCGEDACPAFLEAELEDWPLEDPKGKDLATFRAVRDEIRERMEALFSRLDVT